jgi:hypothetical protein
VRKGGDLESTERRVCLCNGLAATAKDGQRAEAADAAPIVTLGQDQGFIRSLLPSAEGAYSAEDVIRSILA